MDTITVAPSQSSSLHQFIQYWPLWVACAIIGVAAFINVFTYTVSNWLSLGGILTAWGLALLLSTEVVEFEGGGVASAMVSMVVGAAILIPLYVVGGLGGGCVKMQAAYGAWIGCAFPVAKAAVLTGATTVGGALLTVLAGLVIWSIRKVRKSAPKSNTPLPAQLTLSLGALATLAVWLKYVR